MQYTENTEPPISYRLWVGISVMAACLQRRVSLPWGDDTIYPNMYIVLVGPSGKCRKGTAMSPAMKFLREKQIPLAAEATTREALIRALAQSNAASIDLEKGDVHGSSCLTVFAPELVVFLGYNNMQMLADLCDWWDCRDQWEYKTKGRGEDYLYNVWVNIIGATTPDLLQTSLPVDLTGGGLASRIIFVCEEDKGKIVPYPIKTDAEMVIRDELLLDMEALLSLDGEFQLDGGWLERYIPWYVSQSQQEVIEDPRFSGYLSRRQVHLIKLCMILCASRTNTLRLTADDFDRALAILSHTEINMPYTFRGFGTSDLAKATEEICTFVALRGKVHIKTLIKRFIRDVTPKQMTEILEGLSEAGIIKITTKEASGRMVYYVDKEEMEERRRLQKKRTEFDGENAGL
jgi:hypothetical protein